ncbi:MAG TPA: hypothetical protein VFB92_27020 [Vicinamibacterales bacterium]|jgi:hypothetical protein|nr:hypothetical protein [Vicinamibacterales bacterium]
MREEPDGKARAEKLRGRIQKLKQGESQKATSGTKTDSGPKPGESPNAFVERRMRETLKKK